LQDNFNFSVSGIYYSAKEADLQTYRNYIISFPESESPEVFGMHDNANITFQVKESKKALDTILNIQPRDSGAASNMKSQDEIIEDLCNMLEEKLPVLLKRVEKDDAVKKDAPVIIDSMEICLFQECDRFNKLL
jgi:dynein heavy chain